MRLKLDENLGRRCVAQLEAAGYDVATIAGQGMAGAPDFDVISHCAQEDRALVTLDLDFANPLRFNPRQYAGIAVLRLPGRPEPSHLQRAVQTLIGALTMRSLTSHLWIVESERIREYTSEPDDAGRS
jgi:hypothetical protein